jgi:predicted permease
VFASQLTLERWPVRIAAGAVTEQAGGRLVSENYFSAFGLRPAAGRFFTQRDATGVGKDPYAVISYEYWQQRFGARADVVGTTIHLHRATFVIVGVAAKGFRGETVGQQPDVWLPMLMQPWVVPGMDGLKDMMDHTQDKLMWLHVFGRRKAGVSIAQVQAEVNVLFRAILEATYPSTMPVHDRKEALNQYVSVKPLRSGAFHGRNEFAQQWSLLLGLACLVLLVACVNVANLLLARSVARSREVAIRLSLGAGRGRLVRQFLTESLLLAALGGISGLFLAGVVSRGLEWILSAANDGFIVNAGIDWRVLGFTAGATLLTGVLFGLVPALRATRSGLNENLKEAGRGVTGSLKRTAFAKTLVIAQVALSFTLAVGAGLFFRTLRNLNLVELGYRRDHLLLVEVGISHAGYQGARAANLLRNLAGRIAQLPSVRSVSYSDRGLFSGFEGSFPVEVEGFTSQREADRGSTGDSVGPEYFSTIGIPILSGRPIGSEDMASSPRVCIINEAFAKRFFGGRNPIGRHITSWLSDIEGTSLSRSLTVIGVAKDVRVQSLRGAIDSKFYIPGGGEWFEVRASADPNRLLTPVRKLIQSQDSDLTIQNARTLQQALDLQTGQPRLIAQLSMGFGTLALVLVGIGVYGLLSYAVAQRTNEIGIRMALGADRNRVIGMVLSETGFMVVSGVLAGIAVTAAGAKLLATQLYGANTVGPRWSLAQYEHVDSATQLFGLRAMDPLTVGIVVSVLCAFGLMAACLPAARATRVDPANALRHE